MLGTFLHRCLHPVAGSPSKKFPNDNIWRSFYFADSADPVVFDFDLDCASINQLFVEMITFTTYFYGYK